MMKEEVTFVGAPMLSREAALAVMRAFLVPEDMGTPAGAIALRGATNFQTPSGWDTVYAPILNMIERPVAPMLSVGVETDCTRMRRSSATCSSRGRALPSSTASRSVRSSSCRVRRSRMLAVTAEELKTIEASREEFHHHKAAATQQTSYGLSYSPHYLRQSRAKKE